MKLAAAVLAILAFVGTFGAILKVLWHAYGMIRAVRPSANWWVNLIPFAAFSLLGAVDAAGQEHRFKLVRWLFIAAALALACFGFQLLAVS